MLKIVVFILFFFLHVNGYSQVFGINEQDSSCTLWRRAKNVSGTWLMEVGYFKKGEMIYINTYFLPIIRQYTKDGFVSNSDTGYVFTTDRFLLEKYGCTGKNIIDYYADFPELLKANKNKIDSVFIKGSKKRMMGNFKSKEIFFVYLKFSATITYFEDYEYKKSSRANYYYYDFDDKTTTLLRIGNDPEKNILNIRFE